MVTNNIQNPLYYKNNDDDIFNVEGNGQPRLSLRRPGFQEQTTAKDGETMNLKF